jgi:hypothetical protein
MVGQSNWRAGRIPEGEAQTLWGRPVEQVLTALCAFDRLFAEFKPRRIVEWGTGNGGLTAYLAVWARLMQAELLTVDIKDCAKDFVQALRDMPVRFRKGDFLRDPMQAGGGWAIPRTPTLWALDGGEDKAECLRAAAPHARPGDVLLLHDYVPADDYCGKASQVDLSAVAEIRARHGLISYRQEMWDSWHSHWLCLRKAQ